jgi:hypothetical protein
MFFENKQHNTDIFFMKVLGLGFTQHECSAALVINRPPAKIGTDYVQ